jgi:hypothetical protein
MTETLKPRLRQVVDLLPKHRWQVKPAAVEAGYRPSYAQRLATLLKSNVNFCQAVEARRAEIRMELWSVSAWRDECEDALQRARDAHDRSAEVQILRMMGQNIGVFEADNRQRGAESFARLALQLVKRRQGLLEPERKLIESEVTEQQDV